MLCHKLQYNLRQTFDVSTRMHMCQCCKLEVQVQYAALHNFEDREEEFRADVVTLRRRFTADGEQDHAVAFDICCSNLSIMAQLLSLTCPRAQLFSALAGIGVESCCLWPEAVLYIDLACTPGPQVCLLWRNVRHFWHAVLHLTCSCLHATVYHHFITDACAPSCGLVLLHDTRCL